MSFILDCAFAAICAWYAFVLWAMLRDEPITGLMPLLVVCAAAVVTHSIGIFKYPPGFYEDDITNLSQAWECFRGTGCLFAAAGGLGVAMAGYAIIEGTLWQLVPAFWAIRLHPRILSGGTLKRLSAHNAPELGGCPEPC
jgi:hypothetical protein